MEETEGLLNSELVSWLLDEADPGARYLALRDVLRLPAGDPQLEAARSAAHRAGPIATILQAMHPDGYWVKPGPGYTTKYKGTVWSIITLAQLGACAALDARIQTACDYLMENNLNPGGQFSTSTAPSGTVDCLQGNLCTALLDLGMQPARLQGAFEWMARTVTGEGMAPLEDKQAERRYYAYKSGPAFTCGVNDNRPCAWGAAKVMQALSRWPAEQRTPLIENAIQIGVDFLLGIDPATAAYPTRTDSKPSRDWWKFGFPVFYISDLVQIVDALVRLGYGHDPRLANALRLIESKRDAAGRWALEFDYNGKTWVDFGEKRAPSRWVTIRALQAVQVVPARLAL